MKKKSQQHQAKASAAAATGRGQQAPGSTSSRPAREVGGEPTVRTASLPAFLIVLLSGLVYWGGMYIIETGGKVDARVHYPYRSFQELQDLQPKGEAEIAVMKGRILYSTTCGACHQNDGNGGISQNAPPLAGSEWVQAKDPSRIIRIVLNGLRGPITVKGKEWGMAEMVPWRDIYTDEQIAHVLTYIRNAWGNKAPEVKAEQVRKVRDETKSQSGSWTVEELQKVLLKD